MKIMKTFTPGTTYEMRFIGDSQLRPHFTCIATTGKTATFKGSRGEVIKRKIRTDSEGVQYVVEGNYSMAPSISASHVVKKS
jgi:hypothetical protein